jgi:hypothetical protein
LSIDKGKLSLRWRKGLSNRGQDIWGQSKNFNVALGTNKIYNKSGRIYLFAAPFCHPMPKQIHRRKSE